MGAGKTAVGRRLADLLRYDFVDSDTEVENRTGVDISFIFEKEGEAGFRKREHAAIAGLCEREQIVLATGGGAVNLAENRNLLGARGYVVYLMASVQQQLERTRRSNHRPLLDVTERTETLERLLDERAPRYEALADLRINTDGRRVPAVAREIYRQFEAE